MKITIIAFICFGFSCIANSQISRRVSYYIFKPQLYISANGGVNMIMSEGFGSYSVGQSVGSIVRASVGYNFTPTIGVNGSFGFVKHSWPDIRFDNTIIPFSAQNITIDLTVNLSNYYGKYNLSRPYDFMVFAGTGLVHRNKATFSKDTFLPVARAGIQGCFHLSQFIDLNLIAEGNILSDNYNDYTSKIPVDIYPAILAGITYHFRTIEK